jgi:hypothetical protein
MFEKQVHNIGSEPFFPARYFYVINEWLLLFYATLGITFQLPDGSSVYPSLTNPHLNIAMLLSSYSNINVLM